MFEFADATAQELAMKPSTTPQQATPPIQVDGLEVLDLCHRNTVTALGKLAALVEHLATAGADLKAQALAAEVFEHFSVSLREHHQDEERVVFPRLLLTADAVTAPLVRRLQQDHAWLEEDWLELSPQIDAVACGQAFFDLDLLREGSEIFRALLHDHITLEESVIYPSVRSQMLNDQQSAPGRAMAAERRAGRAGSPRTPSSAV
jgi:iron-sulfur cluster repair protein YtfE (RIC family)